VVVEEVVAGAPVAAVAAEVAVADDDGGSR
jgi:hypothetical protein